MRRVGAVQPPPLRSLSLLRPVWPLRPLSLREARRHASTRASVFYQGDSVPRSLTSTGRVGTHRDTAGSDEAFFGVEAVETPVELLNGRDQPLSLDENGFCLVEHATGSGEHIDYFNNEAILSSYYGDCEALVRRATGATRVVAFDHNLRSRARKAADEALKGDGANAVQEPLVTYGVHNDYTLTSAPRRIEQLCTRHSLSRYTTHGPHTHRLSLNRQPFDSRAGSEAALDQRHAARLSSD